MFSELDKDYIRASFPNDTIAAIRYVRLKTGANLSEAKDFVNEVFNDTASNVGTSNTRTNIFAAELGLSDNNSNQNSSTTSQNGKVINKVFKLLCHIIKSFFKAIGAGLGWAIYFFIKAIGGVIGIELIALIIYFFNNFEEKNWFNMYIDTYFYTILSISILVYIACVGIAFIYCFLLALANKDPFADISKQFNIMNAENAKKRQEAQEQYEKDKETRRQARIMQDEWKRRNRWH